MAKKTAGQQKQQPLSYEKRRHYGIIAGGLTLSVYISLMIMQDILHLVMGNRGLTAADLLIQILSGLFLALLLGFLIAKQLRNLSTERELARFVKESDEAMAIVAANGSEVYLCNRAFRQIWGDSRPLNPGTSYSEYFKYLGISLEDLIEKGEYIVKGRKADLEVALRIHPTTWENHKAYVIRALEYDMGVYDPLTLLPNSYFFEKKAEGILQRMREGGQRPVILYYDIMKMKLFNAEQGYEEGDKIIKKVSQTLRKVYEGALIARFSNDHFCILTLEDGLERKLRIVQENMEQQDSLIRLELKVGICRIQPDDDSTISAFCDRARMAMDQIRQIEDRYFCYYDEDVEWKVEDIRFINENFQSALENQEILVYYQPVVRTLTGSLSGLEALARWNSPELGFLQPGRFIPALESTRQIHLLDRHIIRESCKLYRNLADRGYNCPPISFNLSRLDFQLCDVYSMIVDAADCFNVPHNRLRIELTEDIIEEDVDRMRREIRRLRSAGFHVWIDGFGRGHDSINTLKNVEVDAVKIDMRPIGELNFRSMQILESTIRMAKSIGIETLAEAVETEAQYEFLKSIGCEKAQGFLFGKPEESEAAVGQSGSRKFKSEEYDEGKYYHTAGKMDFASKIPLGIFEANDRKVTFLYANDPFRQALQETGSLDPESLARALSDPKSSEHAVFQRAKAELGRWDAPFIRTVTTGKGALIQYQVKEINSYRERYLFSARLHTIIR
jgi:diguanylate cyclase (GGDEF)-like protein